jgi:hypothetical protein
MGLNLTGPIQTHRPKRNAVFLSTEWVIEDKYQLRRTGHRLRRHTIPK